MRRWVLLSLMWAGVSQAEMNNYFTEYPLQSCRASKLGTRMLQFCAVSDPAGDRSRAFSLTVRDPSQREAKDKSTRALHDAPHKLLAEEKVSLASDEYLQFERTAPINLSDALWLIAVPVVKGVPDDYDVARILLYTFDGKRFVRVAESPACGPGCKDQSLQIRSKPGSPEKSVMVVQRLAEGSKTLEYLWNGKKLTGPR